MGSSGEVGGGRALTGPAGGGKLPELSTADLDFVGSLADRRPISAFSRDLGPLLALGHRSDPSQRVNCATFPDPSACCGVLQSEKPAHSPSRISSRDLEDRLTAASPPHGGSRHPGLSRQRPAAASSVSAVRQARGPQVCNACPTLSQLRSQAGMEERPCKELV